MEMPRVEFKELSNNEQPESSAKIRGRVELARHIQTKRFTGTDISCNAYMGRKYINKFCKTSKDAQNLLESAFARLNMSARAYDRVLKVARTIADLDGAESIDIQHIAEAIQFRSLDRKFF